MEKNSWLDRDYEVATAFDLRKIALLLLAPLVIAGAVLFESAPASINSFAIARLPC